jgi:plastocyanin
MGRWLPLGLCVILSACGGGNSTPAPTPVPPNPNTFTITSAGVSPAQMIVAPGTRVAFVNNDTRRHDMTSDPHPDHTDCTEINAVGVLNARQSRETGNLVTVRTCGFHDHDNPDDARLKGQIVIR